MLEIGNAGNLYIDERAPWSLFKQGAAASEAAAKVSFFPLFFFKRKNCEDHKLDFPHLK